MSFSDLELQRIAAAYRTAPLKEEHRVTRRSLRDLVEALLPEIEQQRAQGYTLRGICEQLAASGAHLSEGTLKNYLQQARKNRESTAARSGRSDSRRTRRGSPVTRPAQTTAQRSRDTAGTTASDQLSSPRNTVDGGLIPQPQHAGDLEPAAPLRAESVASPPGRILSTAGLASSLATTGREAMSQPRGLREDATGTTPADHLSGSRAAVNYVTSSRGRAELSGSSPQTQPAVDLEPVAPPSTELAVSAPGNVPATPELAHSLNTTGREPVPQPHGSRKASFAVRREVPLSEL